MEKVGEGPRREEGQGSMPPSEHGLDLGPCPPWWTNVVDNSKVDGKLLHELFREQVL